MKKIFLSIVLMIGFLSSGFGQSVTYRVTKNDPYDIKNLSVAIDPLFMDINGQNGFSGGWGLRADFLYGKLAQINFDMRSAFGTRGYDIKDKNTRNYFYMEGALGLIISNKEVTRNLPIILSSSSYSSGGYTYTRTVSIRGGVPGIVRKMVMLRAGSYQMTNTFSYKGLDSTLMFKSSAGTFTRKQMESRVNTKDYQVEFGGFASTAIFAGFNFKTITQLVLDVDGYGTRGNIRYTDFYIDGIFAPIVSLKNFNAMDTVTDAQTKFDVKKEGKRLFGWRMGWMMRKPKDQGFSFKFEFGQRPDFKRDKYFKDMYMMMTFGLYVPLRIKPIYDPNN